MRIHHRVLLLVASTAMLAASFTSARAATLDVFEGFTQLKLTSFAALSGLGIGVSGTGDTIVSPGSDGVPLAYFPVTGGSLDTGTAIGEIDHDDSGLALSKSSTTVLLENFSIAGDLDLSQGPLWLTGTVMNGATTFENVPLFDLTNSGNPFLPYSVSLASPAASLLNLAFGTSLAPGLEVGLAGVVPVTAPVPEPGTYVMLALGLVVIGVARMQRTARLG